MELTDWKICDALKHIIVENRFNFVVNELIHYIVNYINVDLEYVTTIPAPKDMWPMKRQIMTECDIIKSVLWILCVEMFGDYGGSIWTGWIEDSDGAIKFLKQLVKVPYFDDKAGD